MFNPYISTGIGVGIQGYDNIGFVPFFANVRFNAVKGTITPFVSFDAGYSFSTDEIAFAKEIPVRGGIYSDLSIGIKFFTRKTQALAFSFGYHYQQMQVYIPPDFYYISQPYWEDHPFESMAMKFSLLF